MFGLHWKLHQVNASNDLIQKPYPATLKTLLRAEVAVFDIQLEAYWTLKGPGSVVPLDSGTYG